MRRLLSMLTAVGLVLGMVAGLGMPAATAQETPGGGAVVDYQGNRVAELRVEAFEQPFAGHSRSSSPQSGFEYVAIIVTVTNVGERPYSPFASDFYLIDRDGFVTSRAFVETDSAVAPRTLSSSALEPGESRTGAILFEVLRGTEISAVVYRSASSRFALLAGSGDLPPIGGAIDLIGAEGGVIGSISIDRFDDPMTDLEGSSEPRRGYHYASAIVTIENTGNRPLDIGYYDIKLIDSDGYLLHGSSFYRGSNPEPPNLSSGDLAPGESVTGVVAFELYDGARPVLFAHSPARENFLILGAFEAADLAAPSLADLPAVAEEELSEEDAALLADCQAFEAWFDRWDARLNGLDGSALPDDENIEESTIDALIDFLDQLEDARAEQAADLPPAIGADAQQAALTLYDLIIEAFNALADAKEDGELLAPVVASYEAAVIAATEAFMLELTTAAAPCPESGP